VHVKQRLYLLRSEHRALQCEGRREFVHDCQATEPASSILAVLVERLNQAAADDQRDQAESGALAPADTARPAECSNPACSGLGPCRPSACLDAQHLHLFFAGKPLDGSRPLSAALGANEKTRAVVWVHPRGAGRPPREPALSPAEEQAVMAWRFQRQEAEAAALRADAPEHGCQGWADPTQLRVSFQGLSAVRLGS
jgi:Cilia- and flagella-associated protein 298